MKIIVISLLVVLIGCIGLDRHKKFADGVFVYHSKNEMQDVSDTLIARHTTGIGFILERNLSVRFFGKSKTEKSSEKWSGIYQADDKMIIIPKSGKIVFIDRGSNRLLIGSRFYVKISQ